MGQKNPYDIEHEIEKMFSFTEENLGDKETAESSIDSIFAILESLGRDNDVEIVL